MSEIKNVAILGAGGLGRAAVQLLDRKREFRLVAICDRHGYAHCPSGLSARIFDKIPPMTSVGTLAEFGAMSDDPIGEIIALGDRVAGVFVALPNLPNEFIPSIARRFADEGWSGAMVDALKRSSAVRMMLELNDELAAAGIAYVTGAGATPGLLSAAAALAAQSFVEVLEVEIYFGVGIANWDAYRATIREDIAHLEGFSVERAKAMTNDEVAAELDRRGGVLELVNMEHADDVMLERAGVCPASRVKVGGIVDTRSPKKPVSTRVTVTGRTYDGSVGTHRFTLADESVMAANVNGTAMGYLKTAMWLRSIDRGGVFTAADLMPRFPR
jgi:hypothetical protein